MLSTTSLRIWLYLGVANMRKQFDGLVALVTSQIQMQAQLGDWFVFVNRKRTLMKVLYYHQGGYSLWSKRLERGTSANVAGKDNKTALNVAQLLNFLYVFLPRLIQSGIKKRWTPSPSVLKWAAAEYISIPPFITLTVPPHSNDGPKRESTSYNQL